MRFDPRAPTPITLDRAVALVLHDWLSRNEQADSTPGDNAEQRALWKLNASLEKVLVEPFQDSYGDLLREAKAYLTPDE